MENITPTQILTPHEYPWWIRIPGLFIALLVMCTIPLFLLYELPEHRELSARIKSANAFFEQSDYVNAISLYSEIVGDYPSYDKANIQIAKSFFALSESNSDLYDWGLYLLADKTFSKKEFDTIASYVPKHYREDFLSNFKKVEKA